MMMMNRGQREIIDERDGAFITRLGGLDSGHKLLRLDGAR